MHTATDDLGYTTTTDPDNRIQVRCTTCRRSGWITYTRIDEDWTDHLGRPAGRTRLHHPATDTYGNAADLERFALRAARAVRDCGHRLKVIRVKATYNPDRTCDARCANAVGPACSCSCGGEGHGKAHSDW